MKRNGTDGRRYKENDLQRNSKEAETSRPLKVRHESDAGLSASTGIGKQILIYVVEISVDTFVCQIGMLARLLKSFAYFDNPVG
jgi:hypothetical protein